MQVILKLIVAVLITGFVGFLLPTISIFHERDNGLFPVGNSLAGFVTLSVFIFLVWRIFKANN